MTVGRLEPQKNHEALVSAFAPLAKKYPDWQLRIVGEGSLRQKLEKLIHDLRLESHVQLPGVIKDIQSEYERASIFAMPSIYESFGLVTAEALLNGLPVVGFKDCPGTNALVSNESNGLLVPDELGRFSDALEALISDSELRAKLSRGASAFQLGPYALPVVLDDWEKLLKSLKDQSQ